MKLFKRIDGWIFFSLIPLMVLSLSTLNGFNTGGVDLMQRQLIFMAIGFGLYILLSHIDLSFVKQSRFLLGLYLLGIGLLTALIFLGSTNKGATSWFDLGGFSFQPSELLKLILIFVLAKYLARRHVEIRAMKHVIITGLYFVIPFILILLQPDFGSALIVFIIWFGMILAAGISKKHLLLLFGIGSLAFVFMWGFVFQDYQKARIKTFIDPLSDIQGAGYNAYQSVIAVGSGEIVGKGVGYGTQSRLSFLPEYETDFIFAAVSEEWGFIGSIIILILFGVIVLRIILLGYRMHSNFELLFSLGVALYYMSHVLVNVGMNIGLMPVTGVPLPFMSYGGTHIVIEYMALGIVMSFCKSTRSVYKDNSPDVFLR